MRRVAHSRRYCVKRQRHNAVWVGEGKPFYRPAEPTGGVHIGRYTDRSCAGVSSAGVEQVLPPGVEPSPQILRVLPGQAVLREVIRVEVPHLTERPGEGHP